MYRYEKPLFWNLITRMVVGILLLTLGTLTVQAQTSKRSLLVRVQPDASPIALLQDHASCLNYSCVAQNLYHVKIKSGQVAQDVVSELQGDSRVTFAEVNSLVSIPEQANAAFIMSFDATPDPGGYVNQNAYPQIDLGDLTGAPYRTVTVAVLDTGADLTHVALLGRFVPGYNFLDPTSDPLDLNDGNTNAAVGHGTMIAGIIARTSPHSLIMPIRVLNADGEGTLANVIAGIEYAVNNGASVINMSFGNNMRSRALQEALQKARNAGVVLVASAGNDSAETPHYPAAYASVIGVASVNSNNILSTFSNYGDQVSVCAPGEGIRSTFWTGGYATWSGTSFAAPWVAAEAAELAVRHPHWKVCHIADQITASAFPLDTLNPTYADRLGTGLIDVQAAISGNY